MLHLGTGLVTASSVLRIRDLKTELLNIPTLDVPTGECVALMGPSGAGKSLLLRAIADLDPNEGEVFLDDAARSDMPAFEWRRRVVLIPAESGWWADTVAEHFTPGSPDISVLEALDLSVSSLHWSVSRLSSGERHRLAIARALSLEPKALLLDEPSASLDEISTKNLESVLKNQLARSVAILLVTHEAAQAERLAARTLKMTRGRISDDREAAV